MKFIIDNNILFSLMKPDSMNSKIFSMIKAEFYAPEFLIDEFKKYESECMRKSGLSERDFIKRKNEIFGEIQLVDNKKFINLINEILDKIFDSDDAPYVALSLYLNIPLWSNDKNLKNQEIINQEIINVLSTSDIVKIIF